MVLQKQSSSKSVGLDRCASLRNTGSEAIKREGAEGKSLLEGPGVSSFRGARLSKRYLRLRTHMSVNRACSWERQILFGQTKKW